MKKNLYICYSYYHLFIAIIKCIRSKESNDLVIADELNINRIIQNNRLIEKIRESKIFNQIFFFDYSLKQFDNQKSSFKSLKNYLLILSASKNSKINYNEYDEIYVFNDEGLIGRVINHKKVYYNLIEDGTDCIKKNLEHFKQKNSLKNILKSKVFGVTFLAQSKYIKSIEVNDKSGIDFRSNILIEVSKLELINSLTTQEKKRVFDIFLNDFDISKYQNCSLLVTQPFLQDGVFTDEKDQIQMYKKIIDEQFGNNKFIIKTHPRESVNYSNYFKNCIVISEPFPIEILNFQEEIRFDKVVTITSTSINLISNANEKIFLGWQWLEDYKKGSK